MPEDRDALARSVDAYLEDRLDVQDDVLVDIVKTSEAEGLPPIQVSPTHGRLLTLLCQIAGASRVLEVGTLGGYSTVCLARGVGLNGHVTTLELSEHHAEVARANLEAAGVSDTVSILIGPAAASLETLITQGAEPFDVIFIDADKESNPLYVESALALSRPGTLIYVDNVVRDGAVLETSGARADVRGTREMFDVIHNHDRLEATAIQTVGYKGYDGFALCRVVS